MLSPKIRRTYKKKGIASRTKAAVLHPMRGALPRSFVMVLSYYPTNLFTADIVAEKKVAFKSYKILLSEAVYLNSSIFRIRVICKTLVTEN